MTDAPELRSALEDVLANEHQHTRRLILAAAIVSEALRRNGIEATLVGGGAVEFHAPSAHTTSDIDLVVDYSYGLDARAALDDALGPLGFVRRHRHWVREDLFVEVPGEFISDPTETYPIGPYTLRVVRKETALADRIIGFKYWRVTEYGFQAVAMIAAFGTELDEPLLITRLREDQAEDAYIALRELARSQSSIDEDLLQAVLNRLSDRRMDTYGGGDER
jgi:hypothetical protein